MLMVIVEMAEELGDEPIDDASKDLPGLSIGRELEAQARVVSSGRHQPATVRQYEPHIARWRVRLMRLSAVIPMIHLIRTI